MGAHILEEDWAKYKKEKPRMPCMVCGIHSAIGESMKDPSQVAGCPIAIVKGSTKAILKPLHQCKVVGNVDYSLASAAKSTLTNPCTNRPVRCKHCDLFIASYSMQAWVPRPPMIAAVTVMPRASSEVS